MLTEKSAALSFFFFELFGMFAERQWVLLLAPRYVK